MENVFCFVAINFCETDVNCSVISVVSSNDGNDINKTISDGGITVDFSIIKVHTSN